MDVWLYLFTNLMNGIMGIILLIGGYKIFDWLTPKWDFSHIIENANLAGAIIIASFIAGLAWVVSSATF